MLAQGPTRMGCLYCRLASGLPTQAPIRLPPKVLPPDEPTCWHRGLPGRGVYCRLASGLPTSVKPIQPSTLANLCLPIPLARWRSSTTEIGLRKLVQDKSSRDQQHFEKIGDMGAAHGFWSRPGCCSYMESPLSPVHRMSASKD